MKQNLCLFYDLILVLSIPEINFFFINAFYELAQLIP